MSLIAGLDPSAGVKDPAALTIIETDGRLHWVREIHVWKPRDLLDCARESARLISHHRPETTGFDSQGIGRDFRVLAVEGELRKLTRLFPIAPVFTVRPPRQDPRDLAVLTSKTHLASVFMAAIRTRRFRCSGVPLGQVLRAEIETFETWQDPSGITRCGARKGCHDDAFWSAAMAVFLAERLAGQGALNAWKPL